MTDLIVKKTNKGDLYEVVPNRTFFIAYHNGGKTVGSGLDNTGWDSIDKAITYIEYVLSTGKVITLPRYKKYLHLVEASMSVDRDKNTLYGKNYHNVFIKGYTGDKIITHRIPLRAFDRSAVGQTVITVEDVSELYKYGNSWKEGI